MTVHPDTGDLYLSAKLDNGPSMHHDAIIFLIDVKLMKGRKIAGLIRWYKGDTTYNPHPWLTGPNVNVNPWECCRFTMEFNKPATESALPITAHSLTFHPD